MDRCSIGYSTNPDHLDGIATDLPGTQTSYNWTATTGSSLTDQQQKVYILCNKGSTQVSDYSDNYFTVQHPDVCPNVPGKQNTGPCADQECVNQGGTWNGTSCDFPPPPPPPTPSPSPTLTPTPTPSPTPTPTPTPSPEADIAVSFVFATSTLAEDESGTYSHAGVFFLVFDVEAVGGTVYLAGNADATTKSSIGTSTDETLYRIEHNDTATTGGLDDLMFYTDDDGAIATGNGNVELENGETTQLTVAVLRENQNNQAGFYKLLLKAIAWDTVDNVYADGLDQYHAFTSGLEDFQTEYLFLRNPVN